METVSISEPWIPESLPRRRPWQRLKPLCNCSSPQFDTLHMHRHCCSQRLKYHCCVGQPGLLNAYIFALSSGFSINLVPIPKPFSLPRTRSFIWYLLILDNANPIAHALVFLRHEHPQKDGRSPQQNQTQEPSSSRPTQKDLPWGVVSYQRAMIQ